MKSVYYLFTLLALTFLPSFGMELAKQNDNTSLTRERSSSDSDILFTLSTQIPTKTTSELKIKRLKKDNRNLKEMLNGNKWATVTICAILLTTNVLIALNCSKCQLSNNSYNLPYPYSNSPTQNNNDNSFFNFILSQIHNATTYK